MEMGLVCEMGAHTHTFISPLCRERRPRSRLQSFHGGFGSGVTTRSQNEEAKNSQRQNYSVCTYNLFVYLNL